MNDEPASAEPRPTDGRVKQALQDFDYFFDRWILATPLKSFLIFLAALAGAIFIGTVLI
ncbi:MAG: hypothetical protein ACFB00_09535 [Parvularculaceae bacterium]